MKYKIVNIFSVLASINFLAALALVLVFYQYQNSLNIIVDSYEKKYRSYLLGDELRQSSDDLTRVVRHYGITGDKKYLNLYFDILDIRNGKKLLPENYHRIHIDSYASDEGFISPVGPGEPLRDRMSRAGILGQEFSLLDKAKDESDKLALLEIDAIEKLQTLINTDGLRTDAHFDLIQSMLYSEDYKASKTNIMVGINRFAEVLEVRTNKEVAQARARSAEYKDMLFIVIALGATIFGVTLIFVKRRVISPIQTLTQVMDDLSQNKKHIEVPEQGRRDEIGSMAKSIAFFKNTLQEVTNKGWIISNTSKISDALQHTTEVDLAANALFRSLIPLIKGAQASLYIYDENTGTLFLRGGYALGPQENQIGELALGQGITGQCAQEQKQIILKDVPPGYSSVLSGTGQSKPLTIAAFPLVINQRLRGVIEIASFDEIGELETELMKTVIPVVTLYLDNILKTGAKTEAIFPA